MTFPISPVPRRTRRVITGRHWGREEVGREPTRVGEVWNVGDGEAQVVVDAVRTLSFRGTEGAQNLRKSY